MFAVGVKCTGAEASASVADATSKSTFFVGVPPVGASSAEVGERGGEGAALVVSRADMVCRVREGMAGGCDSGSRVGVVLDRWVG